MVRLKKKSVIQFEIKFFQGVLNKSPRFAEAMMALADLYTMNGEHEKGLVLDEKLSCLCPENPVVLYNLACSYSLMNDIDKAYRSVKKAINCGYDDLEHMDKDSDLDNLRKDVRFRKLFSRAQKEYGYQRKRLFYEI